MELIRTVMLNVIAIVFFTTLLDALLPDGSMRSYLKMAMGFFVVLTFLQPVMQLLQPDGMLQQWQLAFNAGTMECLPVQGEQYEQHQNKVDAACQQKIEEQIKDCRFTRAPSGDRPSVRASLVQLGQIPLV